MNRQRYTSKGWRYQSPRMPMGFTRMMYGNPIMMVFSIVIMMVMVCVWSAIVCVWALAHICHFAQRRYDHWAAKPRKSGGGFTVRR